MSEPVEDWVRVIVRIQSQRDDSMAYAIEPGIGLTDLAWRLAMQQMKEDELRRLTFEGIEPGVAVGNWISVPQANERVANAAQAAELLGPLESFDAGYPQLTLHARRASGEHVMATFSVSSASPPRLVDGEIVGFSGALGTEVRLENGTHLPWEHLEQDAYSAWLEFAADFVTRNVPLAVPAPKPRVVPAGRLDARQKTKFGWRPRNGPGRHPKT